MTRPGHPWEVPVPPGARIIDVAGDDAALADAARGAEGAFIRFLPDGSSDLARALGLGSTPPTGTTAAPVDLIDLGHGVTAANVVVLGVAPDRLRRHHRARRVAVDIDGRSRIDDEATTVVITNGQFLRGADVAPRGHPGDGRIEVQVYALAPRDRREMRRRLARGDHVPHPQILEASGKRISVQWYDSEQPVEVDGHPLSTAGELGAVVLPAAAHVLL